MVTAACVRLLGEERYGILSPHVRRDGTRVQQLHLPRKLDAEFTCDSGSLWYFTVLSSSDTPFPAPMESLEDRSSTPDHASSLESHRSGKLGRIAGHTRGLVEDLREWIDLRLDLAILEIEEEVDDLRNQAALGVTLAFFGFFAALFVFTTIALGLGWALGHPFWGFLIVSVLLVLIVAGLSQARPDLMPSSNLYETIRGQSDASEDSDRPIRNADASVADREEAPSPQES